MMNDYTASTVPILGELEEGKQYTTNLLIDHELGGIGLSDASKGNDYQLWTGEVLNLRDIYFSAPNTSRTLVYSAGYQITELSISFDQNMHPYAAFVENNIAKLYWFDSSIPGTSVMTLATDVKNPRITLDIKNSFNTSISDVLLFYLRGTSLYVRVQRERFLIEHLVKSGIEGSLLKVGANNKGRLQYVFGVKMTEDELLKELAKGSPISSSEVIVKDSSTAPSDSDIWELERKD